MELYPLVGTNTGSRMPDCGTEEDSGVLRMPKAWSLSSPVAWCSLGEHVEHAEGRAMAAIGESNRTRAVPGESEPITTKASGDGVGTRNEVTAVVGGTVVQAGVIAGGVHVHGQPEVRPPRQLPAMPTVFVGRERALADLDAAVDHRTPGEVPAGMTISTIGGTGGIGKTWLALCWAHRRLGRFPDGQLFVDLRGFTPNAEPVGPTTAIRGFLDALGVEPGRVPHDLDEQAALYRSLTADRCMLIVLDNALSAAQVEPLLPGGRSCVVVITGRRTLNGLVTRHGARHIPLDVLADDEARAALELRLGQARLDAEPAATSRLLAQCRGLPLALAIVAGRAHTSPSLPLAQATADIDEFGVTALDDDDPTASLPAVLGTSYRALSRQHRHVVRLLALAPGPDIGPTAAASLTGTAPDQAARALRVLHEASLLEQDGRNRYRMHDLVRRCTNERVEEPGESREALRRLVDHYLHTGRHADRLLYPHRDPLRTAPPAAGTRIQRLPGADEAMAWFDTEHPNLLAALHTAATHEWHHTVWQLAWTLDTFHFRRGRRADRLSVWKAAVHAASHIADPTARISAHRNLGIAYAVFEDPRSAIVHLHEALTLAEQHHAVSEQARTHQMLGWAWQWCGDFRRARDHADAALALHDRLDQPVRRADTLNQIGWYAAHLGDHDIAHERFRVALSLHAQHRNPDGEATALDGLGYVDHARGRHRDAIRHYERALVLRRRLGHTYGEADVLERLGHAHAALGDQDQARRIWLETLNRCEEQQREHDIARVRRLLAARPPVDGE
ncbi:ATP-binding protein [Saccharothrix syringae]|uniref:Tetratricopeptide repeat protein n=1 Tax=Saccharothrix syringae TaxID=103733 RepID=A0A5Q0GYH3_SACSY|nr:tetratricopeptide repeat protein [Saccharothrix syringae]QFZ18422.1 tetratricopeptide repeat protein [Saccharothrix syringae]